jgi:hypothetical protein
VLGRRELRYILRVDENVPLPKPGIVETSVAFTLGQGGQRQVLGNQVLPPLASVLLGEARFDVRHESTGSDPGGYDHDVRQLGEDPDDGQEGDIDTRLDSDTFLDVSIESERIRAKHSFQNGGPCLQIGLQVLHAIVKPSTDAVEVKVPRLYVS